MGRGLLLPILLVLALLAGCGYHSPRGGEGALTGVQDLHIELFENRSAEPFLEDHLTAAVVRRFARSAAVRLVEAPDRADAVLSGVIVAYDRDAAAYGRDDDIREYLSAITVEAALRRPGEAGELWSGRLKWNREYAAGLDGDKAAREERETGAIEESSRRLADELFHRIQDGF